MDNSLLREIKDEARRDKITKFFAHHKKTIIKAVSALFVLLVAYFIYDYLRYQKEKDFSKIYQQAIMKEERGEFVESTKLLKSIYESSSAPVGVKALASLRYAAASITNNDMDKALEIYEEIAFKNKYDDYLQNLSGLLLAKLIIINLGADPDQQKAEQTIIRIKKIVNNNKILTLQAKEQLAIVYIKLNKKEEARDILENIRSDKGNTGELQKRVENLIKLTS